MMGSSGQYRTVMLAGVLVGLIIAALGFLIIGQQRTAPEEAETATPGPRGVQRVSDVSQLFMLALPADWVVTRNEGRKGIQLSVLGAQSPDFRRSERGAEFSVRVVRGRAAVGEEGARTADLEAVGPITIGGITGTFRVGVGSSTETGRDLDAIVHQDGLNYIFSLRYNPATYPQGEAVFREILASFQFTAATTPPPTPPPTLTPSPPPLSPVNTPTPSPSVYPRPNVWE